MEGPEGAAVDENGLVSWLPVFMDDRLVIRVSDTNDAASVHGFELRLENSEVEIGDSFPVTGRVGAFGFATLEVPAGKDFGFRTRKSMVPFMPEYLPVPANTFPVPGVVPGALSVFLSMSSQTNLSPSLSVHVSKALIESPGPRRARGPGVP